MLFSYAAWYVDVKVKRQYEEKVSFLPTEKRYAGIPETYVCAAVIATIGECGFDRRIWSNKDRRWRNQWEQKEKQDEKSVERESNLVNSQELF